MGREAVAHVKSRDFRDQFFKLMRNDDIYIRLMSLHMFMISERLKALDISQENITLKSNPKMVYEFQLAKYRFGMRRYPESYQQFLYSHFYSHLPGDLFFTDFVDDLKISDK